MDWKALTLFMMIMVPLMLILTRALGWLADRKKKRPGAALMGAAKLRAELILEDAREWLKQIEKLDWVEPKIGKPYATYEEYKKDLMGAVPVEDFLERCRAGVPKDPMKATMVARQRLTEIQRRLTEKDRGIAAENSQGKLVTGCWYRRTTGELVVFTGIDGCQFGIGKFLVEGARGPIFMPLFGIEDALPREGEWWFKKECGRKHLGDWLREPARWQYTTGQYATRSNGTLSKEIADDLFAREREAAACGCLSPVNFGKGNLSP